MSAVLAQEQVETKFPGFHYLSSSIFKKRSNSSLSLCLQLCNSSGKLREYTIVDTASEKKSQG